MKNKHGVTIAALIIAIIGLSIGFAAFSNTLTISSSATVTPSAENFKVVFAKNTNVQSLDTTNVTPTKNLNDVTGFTAENAVINNEALNGPALTNLKANFTAPGQSVTYTLNVVNAGAYVAYLKELAFANATNATGSETYKHCYAATTDSNNQALTAAEQATPSLVTQACNGIGISVSIGTASNITPSSASKSLGNQALAANGGYVQATITISYANNASYVDGPMEVEFGTISFTASSNQGSSGQQEQGGQEEPAQVTSLVPTEQEISEFDYDEGKDMYFIAQSHNNSDDFIKYAIENEHRYITAELDSSGIVLMYAFDSDGAAYLTEEWEQTINQNTWYKLGEDGLEEYTGSDPISSLFTSNDIYSTSYFNKLVSTFSN